MDKILAILVVFTGFFFFAFILGFIMAFPVMWLWNYAAAGALGLPLLNVWHAWALSALCTLLFKSHTSSSK